MEKHLTNLFYLSIFFTFFELAAGQSFYGMEASLLLLGGMAAIQFPRLWQRRSRVWNLSEYWLFWAFGFYLLLDLLGALAPASWELAWEKYRVVGLMAFLTLLAVLLLDSREKLDRLFGVLALAAGTAAVLSVLNRMGMGLFPVEYDLRLSLRRDYNMFAVTILLGWCGGAFLQLRKCSSKNRAILLVSTVVCIPAVLLSGSRRGVLLLIPIGLLVAGMALLQGWKEGKLPGTLGGLILCLGLVAAVSLGLENLLHQLPEQSSFQKGEETSVSQRYETISEGSFFSKRRILWRIAWEDYRQSSWWKKVAGQGLGRDVILYQQSGDEELLESYPQPEQREALSAHNVLLADLLSGGCVKGAAEIFLLLALLVDGLAFFQRNPVRALPYGVILTTAVLQNAISGRYGFLYDKWFFLFSFLLLEELFLQKERGDAQ